MMGKSTIFALLSAVSLIAGSASAATRSSTQKTKENAEAQIPVCSKKLGTVAIVEPESRWWSSLGLESPEALIKLVVMKSGCFSLVDRNQGLASRNVERSLADSGELQEGSNIGRAQVKAADYFIVPDIVSKNENSGGGGVGSALVGGLARRLTGGLVGGVDIKKKEANVLLTLVNARTTEQERMSEGYARKSDLSFRLGAGAFWGGFAGVGVGSYSNTEIGQVLVLAYLNAYRDLVTQLGGLPADPSAAAPEAR